MINEARFDEYETGYYIEEVETKNLMLNFLTEIKGLRQDGLQVW